MSLYPAENAMYNLWVPMPIPRTQNAPFFNGRYIEDFLNRIVQHATQAGETDLDKMVKYILDYSSDIVKDTIINMDEFNIDSPYALKWSAAKAALYSLYGTMDKPKEYTEEELKEFFIRHRNYRDFISIGASLKKRGTITEKQYDYYFVLGLPRAMKDWFLSAAPEDKRTRDDPPSVTESLQILKTRFDKKLLIYKDWNSDQLDQAKSLFDDRGNRITTPSYQPNVLDQAVGFNVPGAVPPMQVTVKTSDNHMDELTKKLEALTLAINTIQNQDGGASRRNSQGGGTRRCFMCGNPCGQDGVHQTGPRFCPETNKLITERLITFDAQRNRYVQPDGADLPHVPSGWTGGVASYLRHNKSTSAPASTLTANHDMPLHMRSTHSVGLMFDESEVLGRNGFAMDKVPIDEYISYPLTRSGLDTNKRMDPMTKVNCPDQIRDAQCPRQELQQPVVPSGGVPPMPMP
ncbi:hypothetical protein GYMLUDRAFT_65281 [Collybiopsis luxurians FD-317 M1]|uniref:Unplaced genomic scaffold GYMLUscaffold_156, whole genome shotgun sequence n=1 Tax=Collybiopsis luxurians FD-317 M1 TaxID=944289 RepID=A0A0D0BYB3_9AGAR|nr:hypothetical protein GYMLUDRAFT_65281 [Collybiopsis luxurians FD-317 M1]